MPSIVNVRDFSGGMDAAVAYIHGKWGNEANIPYFRDAILHSSGTEPTLPKFFLLLKEGRIIGCAGLIVNDFISRHDLYPWVSSLFVEKDERGHSYGRLLLDYAATEAFRCGFKTAYLTTDHDGYYEKCGWERMEDGYDLEGKPSRIYRKSAL